MDGRNDMRQKKNPPEIKENKAEDKRRNQETDSRTVTHAPPVSMKGF